MDFKDSPAEAAYRMEARAWLEEASAPFRSVDFRSMSEADELPYSRQWQAIKAKAGYAAIALPTALGGGGGTPLESVIFGQEEQNHNLPFYGYFSIGLGMCMPVMMTYAAPEQKETLIPRLLSGEDIWCQLFSEPAAGSDLAAIRTRAVRDGNDWVINGQKVWTTQGHLADYAILLTRSDPGVPKHKGLTFFFIDMRAPGVDVRPIKQINGEAEFSEVYLTDLRIPDTQRLGEEGGGWGVALTTLMFERQAGSEHSLGLLEEGDVFQFLNDTILDGRPAIDDPLAGAAFADWHVTMEGLRFALYRRLTALGNGEIPGPQAAMGKLLEAKATQDITRFCMDLFGPGGAVWDDSVPGLKNQMRAHLMAAGIRIAGGTDEILRNTIAERVLGLPPEVRTDKNVPFKDL